MASIDIAPYGQRRAEVSGFGRDTRSQLATMGRDRATGAETGSMEMFGIEPGSGRMSRQMRGDRGRALLIALAAALGFVLTACGDGVGPVCTAEAVFGLNLSVRDISGAPAAQGAIGVAIDGAYADTLEVFGDTQMAGAVERAGTYEVTVSKPGYATWTTTGVTVTEDECHVIPVLLVVDLTPVP